MFLVDDSLQIDQKNIFSQYLTYNLVLLIALSNDNYIF